MKWYVKETSVENTVSDFGPFEKLTDAAFFVHQHQMKWSEDFLSKIEIIKVSDSFQINPNITQEYNYDTSRNVLESGIWCN